MERARRRISRPRDPALLRLTAHGPQHSPQSAPSQTKPPSSKPPTQSGSRFPKKHGNKPSTAIHASARSTPKPSHRRIPTLVRTRTTRRSLRRRSRKARPRRSQSPLRTTLRPHLHRLRHRQIRPEILSILEARMNNDPQPSFAKQPSNNARSPSFASVAGWSPTNMGISTHILDTAIGRPAAGVPVTLSRTERRHLALNQRSRHRPRRPLQRSPARQHNRRSPAPIAYTSKHPPTTHSTTSKASTPTSKSSSKYATPSSTTTSLCSSPPTATPPTEEADTHDRARRKSLRQIPRPPHEGHAPPPRPRPLRVDRTDPPQRRLRLRPPRRRQQQNPPHRHDEEHRLLHRAHLHRNLDGSLRQRASRLPPQPQPTSLLRRHPHRKHTLEAASPSTANPTPPPSCAAATKSRPPTSSAPKPATSKSTPASTTSSSSKPQTPASKATSKTPSPPSKKPTTASSAPPCAPNGTTPPPTSTTTPSAPPSARPCSAPSPSTTANPSSKPSTPWPKAPSKPSPRSTTSKSPCPTSTASSSISPASARTTPTKSSSPPTNPTAHRSPRPPQPASCMTTTNTQRAEKVIARCRQLAACTEVPGETTRTFLSPPMHEVHNLLREWMEAAGMSVTSTPSAICAASIPASHPTPHASSSAHTSTPSPTPEPSTASSASSSASPLIEDLHAQQINFPSPSRSSASPKKKASASPNPFSAASPSSAGSIADHPRLNRRKRHQHRRSHPQLSASTPTTFHTDSASTTSFAYLEFHIEQGPVLDSESASLGIVDTIVGQSRLRTHLHRPGQPRRNHPHAPSPRRPRRRRRMDRQRRNLRPICHRNLVATVGKIEAEPNAGNVIPGTVTASLDVRHANDQHSHHRR